MGALVGGLVMGLTSEEDAVAFVSDLCGNARRRFLWSREIRLSGTFDGPGDSGGILSGKCKKSGRLRIESAPSLGISLVVAVGFARRSGTRASLSRKLGD